MRLTRLALALGFVMGAAAIGCGGGSGSGDASTTAAFTNCGYPACYLDLLLPCMPGGACVMQNTEICGASACPTPLTSGTTPTAATINMCWGNGVKELLEMDTSNPSAPTMTLTAKKGSTVCCTMTGGYSQAATATTFTLKNGAGTTVATVVEDMSARTVTITCVGGSPTVVSMDCWRSDGGTSNTVDTCTPGICAP